MSVLVYAGLGRPRPQWTSFVAPRHQHASPRSQPYHLENIWPLIQPEGLLVGLRIIIPSLQIGLRTIIPSLQIGLRTIIPSLQVGLRTIIPSLHVGLRIIRPEGLHVGLRNSSSLRPQVHGLLFVPSASIRRRQLSLKGDSHLPCRRLL